MSADEKQTESPSSKAAKRLWVSVALVGGVALILVAAWSGSLDYYRDVDALVSSQQVDPERPVRVKGTVEPGSIEYDLTSGRTRFRLRGKTHAIDVVFPGDPPPLFAPGREVVVSGYLRPAAPFEAYEVLTKCPSKYEALKDGK